MTIKEAILQSLEELKKVVTHQEIYEYIVNHSYYEFTKGKTPARTVSALLGDFIRKGDDRIKRIKGDGNFYLYYLSKYEESIHFDNYIFSKNEGIKKEFKSVKTYHERDLHKLLSSYLKNKNIYTKTILHEESKNSKDEHQKWIHPDMIGIDYLRLTSNVNKAFMRVLSTADTFKLTSYELKKTINTDYELKKSYFQAVSNSSWANYGYLVALEINSNLNDEMERLNQSFGIGVIELKANPYESKILFQAKLRELDFKTIDKLCRVNKNYEKFIEFTERILSVEERNAQSIEKEFEDFCDKYFKNDSEIYEYCKETNIPILEDKND
ncbi:MAG: hypothetical protein JKY28_02050 [Sulfurimonas sp.]|nr:hypothetical protein [Sulfurimonas sp.]PHQ92528.1 MAG: hypothetical protein COB42_01110 [Sulfurimonas sp.]